MNPTGLASIAVVLAYLIGAIPFAYVIVRAVKGIDIRTVGSGNVGATNASRVLGKRGFLAVFALDMAKGLLPTLGLPLLVKHLGGRGVADLPVLIALATILGHNFPIYLQFKGGKGVATSLGAMFALDWMASLAAALTFIVSLMMKRYVSLSSALGAVVFVVVHLAVVMFLEKKSPWDRDHIALTALTLGLLIMLIWRHRKNWARIREGTEPKVGRRKPPSGRAAVILVIALAILGGGAILAIRLARATTLDCGAFTLVDLGRIKTGHQRAIRPVFGDEGRLLAVLCPRYNRLMIYRVAQGDRLRLAKDVTLPGQPMAVCATANGFLVLERPSGDSRHIERGYLETYRFDGEKLGPRIAVGHYPAELAVIDGRDIALVLSTGNADGNAMVGPPAMELVDLKGGRVASRVTFDHAGEAPVRLSVASSGRSVAVGLRGSNEVAAIDVTDLSRPAIVGRSALPARDVPYPSISGSEWILMPVATDRECVLVSPTGTGRTTDPLVDYLVSVQVDESQLEVRKVASSAPLGTLPLRGSANLGAIRPTGVACSPERGLLAVTSRSGGVHLIAMRAKTAR